MKKILSILILLIAANTLFAQFANTDQLKNYIRDTIKDRRPEKVTAADLQKALLGAVDAIPHVSSLNNYFSGGAGNLTMTGGYNTANGFQSLRSNTTGSYNTSNGLNSLYSNTTGYGNTAGGYQSLKSNTIGYYNTANGSYSLYSNTIGYYNTSDGLNSLYSNTTGDSNTADGYESLRSNTTGSSNTAGGANASYNNTAGSYNVANGAKALYNNINGNGNTANGSISLLELGSAQTAGNFNIGTNYTISSVGTTDFTLIGSSSNTVGITFTATGSGAGTGTATPNGTNNNTAAGYNTGRGITYGAGNTILGANVTGLAAGLTNNIIIANGTGAIKARNDGTNWNIPGPVVFGTNTIAPNQLLNVASITQVSHPFPNMTQAQKSALIGMNPGDHIYQTDGTEGVYVYKSTGWAFAY